MLPSTPLTSHSMETRQLLPNQMKVLWSDSVSLEWKVEGNSLKQHLRGLSQLPSRCSCCMCPGLLCLWLSHTGWAVAIPFTLFSSCTNLCGLAPYPGRARSLCTVALVHLPLPCRVGRCEICFWDCLSVQALSDGWPQGHSRDSKMQKIFQLLPFNNENISAPRLQLHGWAAFFHLK